MELSRSATAPRSSDEAGPSGSSPLPPPSARPAVTEKGQAALSSVEHVKDTPTKLQTDFVLPTKLVHYTLSSGDRDETASVSSISSGDLTKLIPHTNTNKSVYKYENEFNGLLEFDKIDSHGEAEVRKKRIGVVKAVERTLGGVEHVVGEAVEKRLSLTSTTTSSTEEPLGGFDADEDVIEVAPAQEQVRTAVVVDGITVPEQSTPTQVDATPVEGALSPESDTPVEPNSDESDTEASTVTTTPTPVELMSTIKPEPITSLVQARAPETVDTSLLPGQLSPSSWPGSSGRPTAVPTRRFLCSTVMLRRAIGLSSITRF